MKADTARAADGHRDFVGAEALEATAWSWMTKSRDIGLFHQGGTIAWLAAARPGVDAAVGYYGGQIAKFTDEHPEAPIMLHFGKLDQHIPKQSIDAVQAARSEEARVG